MIKPLGDLPVFFNVVPMNFIGIRKQNEGDFSFVFLAKYLQKLNACRHWCKHIGRSKGQYFATNAQIEVGFKPFVQRQKIKGSRLKLIFKAIIEQKFFD